MSVTGEFILRIQSFSVKRLAYNKNWDTSTIVYINNIFLKQNN